MKRKFCITVALLVGITIAGGLLLVVPVQMSVMGGLMIHYLQTLGTPAGTIATELNPSYTSTVAAATSPWSRHQTRNELADPRALS